MEVGAVEGYGEERGYHCEGVFHYCKEWEVRYGLEEQGKGEGREEKGRGRGRGRTFSE